jgi:hypothetical protein
MFSEPFTGEIQLNLEIVAITSGLKQIALPVQVKVYSINTEIVNHTPNFS